MTEVASRHLFTFLNTCQNCSSKFPPRRGWKCMTCSDFYLCPACVSERYVLDVHCSQYPAHNHFIHPEVAALPDNWPPKKQNGILSRSALRRVGSEGSIRSRFTSHRAGPGGALTFKSAAYHVGYHHKNTSHICEFSLNAMSDFNLLHPTKGSPDPIQMRIEEFHVRVHRHLNILQTQLGRLSPLIYYHPSAPRVISVACFKLKSYARFRHEFLVITFIFNGCQYRAQFDRGWRRPERTLSWKWLLGKPGSNIVTISLGSDPMPLEEMDMIGRILYREDRRPLLTRACKHLCEVFADGPSYFLFTWNCWLFARVTFMRALDLGPSAGAMWRGVDLNGQNILQTIIFQERSLVPWVNQLFSFPTWISAVGPLLGVRWAVSAMNGIKWHKLYLRYCLATFTPDSASDFITGKEIPLGAPHKFDVSGLAAETDDAHISKLCVSLSIPGKALYLLTPLLRPYRRRRIQRVEIMYSCHLAGSHLSETQLVDVGVVNDDSSIDLNEITLERLEPTREKWSYNSTLLAGNSIVDCLERGGRLAVWFNVPEGSRVSVFCVIIKIYLQGMRLWGGK